jgi:hypothetical protein
MALPLLPRLADRVPVVQRDQTDRVLQAGPMPQPAVQEAAERMADPLVRLAQLAAATAAIIIKVSAAEQRQAVRVPWVAAAQVETVRGR